MISQVIHEFLKTVLDILPYFIGAVSFSAFLETKLNSDKLLAPFIKGKLAIVWVSVLGGILPGCACATVPLAENLKQKKAGLGVISAFLLAAPLLSPQTIILTYGFLGAKFAVWRVITAMTGAILLGYALDIAEKKSWITMPDFTNSHTHKSTSSCTSSSCCDTPPTFLQAFWLTTKKLGLYFIIGVFIASILTVVIPAHLIPTYIGTGFMAYVIAALIGIPVYVCEGEEIPITQALLNLQLGAGPAFTFMMGAVGTCIPTMLMAKKLIGSKAVLVYWGYWFVFAIGSGLLFNLL